MGAYLCKDAEHAKQAKKENENAMLPASEKLKNQDKNDLIADGENPDIPFADATGDEDDNAEITKNNEVGKVVNDYNKSSLENQESPVLPTEEITVDIIKNIESEPTREISNEKQEIVEKSSIFHEEVKCQQTTIENDSELNLKVTDHSHAESKQISDKDEIEIPKELEVETLVETDRNFNSEFLDDQIVESEIPVKQNEHEDKLDEIEQNNIKSEHEVKVDEMEQTNIELEHEVKVDEIEQKNIELEHEVKVDEIEQINVEFEQEKFDEEEQENIESEQTINEKNSEFDKDFEKDESLSEEKVSNNSAELIQQIAEENYNKSFKEISDENASEVDKLIQQQEDDSQHQFKENVDDKKVELETTENEIKVDEVEKVENNPEMPISYNNTMETESPISEQKENNEFSAEFSYVKDDSVSNADEIILEPEFIESEKESSPEIKEPEEACDSNENVSEINDEVIVDVKSVEQVDEKNDENISLVSEENSVVDIAEKQEHEKPELSQKDESNLDIEQKNDICIPNESTLESSELTEQDKTEIVEVSTNETNAEPVCNDVEIEYSHIQNDSEFTNEKDFQSLAENINSEENVQTIEDTVEEISEIQNSTDQNQPVEESETNEEKVLEKFTENSIVDIDLSTQHISSNGNVTSDSHESDDQSISNEIEIENGVEDVKEEELRKMVSDAVDEIMGDAKSQVQHIVENPSSKDSSINVLES